ncbi:MAG: glycoside hydrolase family 104 protein [Cyanobium sp. M30B3]|nr:MAG: glycoside hydrolase family 104 protein [Cyanobium sp. M30B3]
MLLAKTTAALKAVACLGVVAGPLLDPSLMRSARAADVRAGHLQVATAAYPPSSYRQAVRTINLPPASRRVYAITPERRALLNTIRYAEGTWANGQDVGYRIMFGGSLIDSLDRHPNRVNRTPGYASAAAGAYQFMPPTWAMVSRSLGFPLQGPNAFGPEVQDQAAIYLVQRRGALHLADQGLFSPELAHRLAPEWASFPTMAGRSFYGQPVKRYDELRRFYEWNLANLRAQQASQMVAMQPVQPPEPPKAECVPAGSLRCQLEALESIGPRSPRS